MTPLKRLFAIETTGQSFVFAHLVVAEDHVEALRVVRDLGVPEPGVGTETHISPAALSSDGIVNTVRWGVHGPLPEISGH